MKLGSGSLFKLAEMICGDSPFDFFPYRSSSYLTRFFVDFDYAHNGSTRRIWANDVLTELNNRQSPPNMPSREVVAIIESLLHPENFLFDDQVDRDKAIQAVTSCLNTYDLTIAVQSNGIEAL